METNNNICGVCSTPYDNGQYTPRILITCGHTICSDCLIDIINNPTLRKCPFDSLDLNETPGATSLDTYPINFALLALLEGKNKNICPSHDEKLSIICLKDKIKICSDCALFGEHKGHKIKKIKELKAQGIQAKKDLEEGLEKFKKCQEEKAQEMEAKKQEFLNQMRNSFGEIKEILTAKEEELTKQIDRLFERDMDNHSEFFLKREAEKILEEIDQACQKDYNLAILNQDFSEIISRLVPQDAKKQASHLSERTLNKMDYIESFLTDQANFIKDFDLLNERIRPEQPIPPMEQPVIKEEEEHHQAVIKEEHEEEGEVPQKPHAKFIEEEFEEEQKPSQTVIEEEPQQEQNPLAKFIEIPPQKPAIIKLRTLLTLGLQADSLCIWALRPNPVDLMINLNAYMHIEKINVELGQYSNLFAEPTDLNFLSEIFTRLNKYTSLTISFAPEGLSDHYVICLVNILFCRIQHLEHIDISFDRCEITDDSILFFCERILSKATSLKSLALKFYSTPITNESLFGLAKSIAPFGKTLESFTLGIGKTFVDDDGLERILDGLEGINSLDLQLQRSLVSDRGLIFLGEKTMPRLVNLIDFKLDGNEMRITLEGVSAIFKGIPDNIRVFKVRFEDVDFPDEIIELIENDVCPKMQVAEEVTVRLKGEILMGKVLRVLGEIRREASRRKKMRELNQGLRVE